MSTLFGITLGASFGLLTVSPWLALVLFAVSAAGLIQSNVRV